MNRRLPKLLEPTPEGRIVAALFEAPKSYGELRYATSLSDRWLSKKLKELSSTKIVEHYQNHYQLKDPAKIIDADPLFAQFLKTRVSPEAKAKLLADEIRRDERVLAIILFGSLAKARATEESDVDLLIVTDGEIEDELNSMIYDLMFKYDIPVEAIFQTYDDLIFNLQAKTSFTLGLLEGYRVLYDRAGVEELLSIKKKQIQEDWTYDQVAEAWIQKKLIPTLKPLKTS